MIEIIIIYNDNNGYYCDYYHDDFLIRITIIITIIIIISIIIIKLSISLHYVSYHIHNKYCKYNNKDTK